jgi:hypothetical protein
MVVDGLFRVCVLLGWLLKLWRGADLWPLGMSFQSEIPSRVSFWVAVHGCSFELTKG